MLSTLLPGLREIRARLAAGYCWLALLWLIFRSGIPVQQAATGLVEDVYRAIDWAGKPAVLTVVTFVAYVLGAITVPLIVGPVTDIVGKAKLWLDIDDRQLDGGQIRTRKPHFKQVSAKDHLRHGHLPKGLQGDQTLKETFSRLVNEGEFRLAVAPPLIAICAWLVFEQSAWWLLPLPALSWLVFDALRTYQAAAFLIQEASHEFAVSDLETHSDIKRIYAKDGD